MAIGMNYKEKVAAEFNEKWNFASFCWNQDHAVGAKFAEDTRKDIMSFISTALNTQLEEVVRVAEGMKSGMRDMTSENMPLTKTAQIYNAALTDLIHHLKEI